MDSSNWADLPMEILVQIMSYLKLSDILESSLTCRRWFEASMHHDFVSRIQIQFDKLNDNLSFPLKIFTQSIRSYNKIRLTQVDIDLEQANLEFWPRFGEHFTDIEFNACDLCEKTMGTILKLMINLESLKINNCRELFMSGRLFKSMEDREAIKIACKNLKYLSLCNNRYLSDALFSRIVGTMQNIRSLDLSGCYISFHSALYKKFYPDHQKDASESVFTFFMIMQLIMSQAVHLKNLDFSETLIDGNALNKLAEIECLALEELKLKSCDQLTNGGISKFLKKQTTLLSLDLSQSVRLTDPSLLEICNTLTNLRVLKIRRCRAITDQSVNVIRLLTHLRCLDISECDAITSKGFIEGIGESTHDQLIELHASALNICELAVIKLAQSKKNLRLLDLSFCKNAVTNAAAQMIFKNLTSLRTLNLEFCDMLSDAGITGMHVDQASESSANRMQFESNNKISLRSKAEEDIVNDAKRKNTMMSMFEQSETREEIICGSSIAHLKGLRSLNLASCNRISDVSLKFAFTFLDLEVLNLSKCQQITVIGIEPVVVNCPSIKILYLSDCHNLCDQAIDILSFKLKRLTHLYIERCSQLTDNSLDSIGKNCKRIKYLDVRGCRCMCSEPNLRLENSRSLQHVLISKPGPYLVAAMQPKSPPPMPT